jgi:tetratricopeptide (TPR) repeat protein
MQDHYETLQVHPKADQETIELAHKRLLERYDPAKLAGAAEELVALADEKRRAIELAYGVLGSPEARARYDAQQQLMAEALAQAGGQASRPGRELLDYRPLPPARGQERDKRAAIQPTPAPLPTQAGRRVSAGQRPSWLVPSIVSGLITLTVMITSLLITDGGGGAAPPAPTPAPTVAAQQMLPLSEVVAEYDRLAGQAGEVARQRQTPDAWLQYANALFDSVMVVREREPAGELYQQRLPLWIQATDAYSKVLELDPTNAVARSDLGVSYCYYGKDSGDQELVARGIAQTRQAREQDDGQARVLLNLGLCLVQQEPPATQEALSYWRELASSQADTIEAQQAQLLIERYQ